MILQNNSENQEIEKGVDENLKKTEREEITLNSQKFISARWALLISVLSAINIINCILYAAAQAFVILTNNPHAAVGSGVYGFVFYLVEGIYGLRAMVINTKNSANTLNIFALFGVVGSIFGLVVHIVALSLRPCNFNDYYPNYEDYNKLCFPREFQWSSANSALIAFDGIAMATNIFISAIILGHQGFWDPAWRIIVKMSEKMAEILGFLCQSFGRKIQNGNFRRPQFNLTSFGELLCYTHFTIGFITITLQIIRLTEIYSAYHEVFACLSAGIWAGIFYAAAAIVFIKAQRLKNNFKWWKRAVILSVICFFSSILLIIFSAMDVRYYGFSNALTVFGSLAVIPNILLFYTAKQNKNGILEEPQYESFPKVETEFKSHLQE